MNIFGKIFTFLKSLFTRPGLQQFLEERLDVAREIVAELAQVHSQEDFHEWKDLAWSKVRNEVGNVAGNWISILVAIAFEELKARGKA